MGIILKLSIVLILGPSDPQENGRPINTGRPWIIQGLLIKKGRQGGDPLTALGNTGGQ